MTGILERGLVDPVTRQLLVAIIGVLIILILVRLFQRSLTQHISHSETRYRARKLITFAAYLVAVLFVSIVFRDQLGHLTVALGVATAGVAFALQEVIASFAGWVAISFGRFYQIGDRVQLGGITGDVIDIGMLRTTLMECGAWVNSDLYNGRSCASPTAWCSRNPCSTTLLIFPSCGTKSPSRSSTAVTTVWHGISLRES